MSSLEDFRSASSSARSTANCRRSSPLILFDAPSLLSSRCNRQRSVTVLLRPENKRQCTHCWTLAWSCVTGKCSKRNPLQSVILPVLTGWAIKCLYRQLDFKIVKCTHIVCNFRSYTAIVRCYGHILR